MFAVVIYSYLLYIFSLFNTYTLNLIPKQSKINPLRFSTCTHAGYIMYMYMYKKKTILGHCQVTGPGTHQCRLVLNDAAGIAGAYYGSGLALQRPTIIFEFQKSGILLLYNLPQYIPITTYG